MSACRYCGKPLPFRQWLSGGQEFCTPDHCRGEEYSREDLSHLLSATSADADGRSPMRPCEPDPLDLSVRRNADWKEWLASSLHPVGFDGEPAEQTAVSAARSEHSPTLVPVAPNDSLVCEPSTNGLRAVSLPRFRPAPLRPTIFLLDESIREEAIDIAPPTFAMLEGSNGFWRLR